MHTILIDRLNILGRADNLKFREESLKTCNFNELKQSLYEITKNVDEYTTLFQRKILKSKTIRDVFMGDDDVLKKSLEFLVQTNVVNVEDVLSYSEELKALYLLNLQLLENHEKNSYCERHLIPLYNIVAYMLKLHNKEHLSDKQLNGIFLEMFELSTCGTFVNKFNEFSEDKKLEFLSYLKYDFIRKINTHELLSDFLQSDNQIFEIKEYLYNNGHEDINISFVSNINADEVISIFEKIKVKTSSEEFKTLLGFILFNCQAAEFFELNSILRNLEIGELPKLNCYEDYLNFVYSRYYKNCNRLFIKDTLTTPQIDLIKKAIRNKKKAFLKLVTDHLEDYSELCLSNILFNENFEKVVNINTLNSKNLKELNSMKVPSKEFWNILADTSLTFNELKILTIKTDFIIKLYKKLSIPKIDTKLIVLNQLPHVDTEFFELLDMLEEDVLENLSKELSLKNLSKWVEELHLNISKASYLKILAHKNLFIPYLNDIKSDGDIDILLKLKKYISIKKKPSLIDIKRAYFKNSSEYAELLESLGLSHDFAAENEERIFSFIDRKLVKVLQALIKNSDSVKRKNLKLIAKAELAGKLDKIKFYGNDLSAEIGYNISAEQLDIWKQNLETKKGSVSIKETFDFETTIRIGQYPMRTCMHWYDGVFNECLLSNFDSNKKILAIYNGEKLIGRSILRLTKGTKQLPEEENEGSLKFRDVSELDAPVDTDTKVEYEEHLVLFIEKPYFIDKNEEELDAIYKYIIKFMAKKAKELNALLVVSSSFNRAVEELKLDGSKENYYIFISYSKNGNQYLDSFSGKNTTSNEGSFKQAELYIINP